MFYYLFINKLFTFSLLFLFISTITAQTGSLTGKIINRDNGRDISRVNIFLEEINKGTSTNESGKFFITNIPAGIYTLDVSYIGFKKEKMPVTVFRDSLIVIDIALQPVSLFLGEVPVLSSRYEQLIKNVPLPIALQTGEEIKKIPALTISDALKDFAGISLTRDGIWGTYISIRGFNRSSIVTLVDGNRVETASDIAAGLSMVDLTDIDRIEVVKGSSSSLYGTGALGGVVNIYTKSAYFNNSFYYNGKFTSSYNSVNDQPAVSLSLNTGGKNWYAHFSGMARKAGNTETPRGTLNNSQYKDDGISAAVGFIPFNNNELKLNFQQFNAENVGIPGGSSLFPVNALVSYPREMRRLISIDYTIKNISETFNTLSFKIFNQFIQRKVENIPYQVLNIAAQENLPPKRVSVLKITPDADHNTYGFQVQSDWTVFDSQYLIAGIDGWQRSYKGTREKYQLIEVLNQNDQSVVNTTNKVIEEKPIPDSKFLSIGIFAQNEIELIKDKLNTTIGGRVDGINVTNEKTYNPVYEITNGAINYTPSSQVLYWDKRNINETSYSGNITFLFKAFDGTDFTFNAAHSFRSPSLEERYQYIDQGNVVRLGDPNLKPEKGWFFDLGTRVWKSEINFSGDLFWNSLNDLIVELPGSYEGRNALIKTNIGKARLYGFDLGFQYNFYRSYTVYINGAYVRGKDLYNHSDLPQIPPLNGKFGIKTSEAKYIDIDLSATIFDKQSKIAAGETATPGYAYFDLYLSSIPFEFGFMKYQIFGGIENLADKAYKNHLSTNRGLITIEPGRNYFARISVNW